MEKVLGLLLLFQFSIHHVFTQQDTYRAAVVEFAPKLTGPTPADNVHINTREYILQLEQAARQGAQIIVFPEIGLTGDGVRSDHIDQVSTMVPDPNDRIAPCDLQQRGYSGNSNYSKHLMDLSCAARLNRIYTVVNLVEWQYGENTIIKYFHNTNIVFDRNGIVIARYRKINLFEQPDYIPGNTTTDNLSTFKTDFGVTFGMFICFDIMFKIPAVTILDNPSVTDIIFSTAWYSQLPFYEANSIQHGYAKSNGVNLLAAGLNNPAGTSGGSGIYLADGRILETYLSGSKKTKLIIQNIPKLQTKRNLSNACQSSSQTPYQFESSDITQFITGKSDLSHYTFKSLDLDHSEISETICSGKSSFCCNFNITVNKNSRPNYIYKLVIFHGVKKFSSKTIGQRNCGLVACLNDNNDSCGGRHSEAPTVTFDRISINGTFDHKNSHDQPSTLNFDLKPSTEYMYCTKTSNNKIEINLSTTKPHDSLLTFGLIGRVFDNDDKAEGPINNASYNFNNACFVLITSIFIYLQQE